MELCLYVPMLAPSREQRLRRVVHYYYNINTTILNENLTENLIIHEAVLPLDKMFCNKSH